MKLNTNIEGPSAKVQIARIITLSTVFTELLPFLIFAIQRFSGAYPRNYTRESNEFNTMSPGLQTNGGRSKSTM